MLDLPLVFLAGLLGSAHCAGMCGGFALALGAVPGTRSFAARQGAYYAGKTATYTALGALAGTFGYALFLASGAQRWVSVGLGLALVATGLVLCGVGRTGAGPFARVAGRLARPLGALVGRGTLPAAFGLGALNGLLPCGLVAAFLVQAAAAGSPGRGALTMAVFGVATLPALALTATAGRLAGPRFRGRLQRAGGALVVAVGLLTVVRGTPVGAALLGHAHLHAPGLVPLLDPICRVGG